MINIYFLVLNDYQCLIIIFNVGFEPPHLRQIQQILKKKKKHNTTEPFNHLDRSFNSYQRRVLLVKAVQNKKRRVEVKLCALLLNQIMYELFFHFHIYNLIIFYVFITRKRISIENVLLLIQMVVLKVKTGLQSYQMIMIILHIVILKNKHF